MMRILILLLAAFLTAPVGAQTGRVLIDFGASNTLTELNWNNVHPGNAGDPLTLAYDDGSVSGIGLDFTPQMVPSSTNSSGVTSPQPGSPLAALGWPVNAIRDSVWGGSSDEYEFTLSGLDPTATYDFTIVASRLGAGDARTTHYTVVGLDVATTVLDAADNVSELVRIVGIRPDGSDAIRVTWRTAASNTNTSGFYYLNALGIDEWAGGSQPPLVAFSDGQLDLARVQGKGPFGLSLSTYTNDGSLPTLALAAIDASTQAPASWLTVPATVAAGTPFGVSVDASALPIGTFRATLHATSGGYDEGLAAVDLEVLAPGTLNLLFYGNSYSQGNGGVHANVQALAEQAGLPSPKVVGALVGGQTLNYHLTNPTQAAAITQSLPLGEEWDFVVLQGFSLEATVDAGNPAQFNADAQAIFQNVRAHSPEVRACFFQTWARGWGNNLYPNTFVDPPDMHAQVEASYAQIVADLNGLYGPDTARRAAAGEAIALRNFDPGLYDPDLSHPGPSMSFMAADAIFTSIWGQRVCDLPIDFGQSTNLIGKLNSLGIGPPEWSEDAGVAERAGDPSNRRYPGSSEDLILRTSIDGNAPNACPSKLAQVGQTLTIQLDSPIGEANGAGALIWVDVFPTGSPPTPPPGTPEVHFDASSAVVVAASVALNGTLTAHVPIRKSLLGRSLIVQGEALVPSANTGNSFTTTDAHVVRIAPLAPLASQTAVQ